MQSILLCAGFGTRLKPLTEVLPKPAVPFLNHPMVWYALHAILHAGQTTFAANVHYLPEIMANCLQQCAKDLGLASPMIYHEKDEILGTGGGARACFDQLPKDDCYLIYHGDVLCAADIAQALQAHRNAGTDVTLVVAPRPENSKLGMIGVDTHQNIVQIRNWFAAGCDPMAPRIPACFTGIHIVNHNVLAQIPRQKNVCLVTEIYRQMLESGQPIHAHMTDAFFADIGTPETYIEAIRTLAANSHLLKGICLNTLNTQNIDDWMGLCHTLINALPHTATLIGDRHEQ